MIKSVKLELSGGDFEIIYGNDFSVTSDVLNHLVYEKDGVWHVISDPCHGKYATTTITVPHSYCFTDFQINLTDGALKLCRTESKNIEFNITNASAEAETAVAENLYISVGRANLRISADAVNTNIDCGYGTIDIRFPKKTGYSITSQCGMGNVTLDSAVLPKKYCSANGDRKINIICGMGDVNINT